MCTAVSQSGKQWGRKDWTGRALPPPLGVKEKSGKGNAEWLSLKKNGDKLWGEYTTRGQVRPKTEWDVICCGVM